MRKTNTTGNNISAGRLPQRLLPEGANPWEHQEFVKAYQQVADVVNAIPYMPQIEEAIKKTKPVALSTATVLKTVQDHEPSKKALKLILDYEDSIRRQTTEYLKNSLRFSSGSREIKFSDIAGKLSPNLLLGIPSPSQISAISPEWSGFYRDLLGLLEQVSQNPQNQDLLERLAASALVLTKGIHRMGNQETPSPFSKIHIHPTTEVTGSPSFLPSAETLAQTAALIETHGTAAVQEAIRKARGETVKQIGQITTALTSMLTTDRQDTQKLDDMASRIIRHLDQFRQQYNIVVPDIDTQSALTPETRAKATRPVEELVRAFASIKEIEESRQRRRSGRSRYSFMPPEMPQAERYRSADAAEFHSAFSMYAVGGTKPPKAYETHTRQKALQEAPQLQKEFFEEQMNQYYMSLMAMIATIAGIAARKLADINLRNELNRLRAQQPTPDQSQTTVVKIPVATAYGSTGVRVTSHEFVGSQVGEVQRARGYIPIGLPLGQISAQPMSAQPQLPSTFEEGQVRPTATITMGVKKFNIGGRASSVRIEPSIEAVNPQQAVEHAVPVSKEENQRLFIPIIEVVNTGNNNLRVTAKLREITAPTINDQQIETIKEQIANEFERMINTYSQQRGTQGGRVPETLMRTFEMAKALRNSPRAELHSALLRIEQEALENGTIIRRPVLNITFYLPENEANLILEASRIKEQNARLRAARVPAGETDAEADEEATQRPIPNTMREQLKVQTIGTYKRGQVLQPTFEEAQPGSTNRQTAANRLVVVSFELTPGAYEGLPEDDLLPIEKVVFDIYNQFKEQIESGAFIESDQDSAEFIKDVAPNESLQNAIKEATKSLDFQIARRIHASMLDGQIAQRYTEMINAEYARFLPQARQFPEEFERITQQSALPIFQEGPITFMARPIVNRNGGLELLVLAYARTTPYLLKIQGTSDSSDMVSKITNAYLGVSQQGFEGRKEYSGGIAFRYNLTLTDVNGQTQATLVETPIQKVFAPDATLASGAVGLPSGIVTIVGSAGAETAQITADVAETARQETIMQADDDGSAETNTATTGTGPTNTAALVRQWLARTVAAEPEQTSVPEAPAPAPQAPEPEPEAPAPAEPQPAPQPAPNQDIRVLNKLVGSIKKVGQTTEQQKEWIEIYRNFKTSARITLKEISHGRNERRGISKQLLMLIGGAQRAEHRLAIDQIVDELQGRPVFASEATAAQVPDLIGETPETVRMYKTAPVGQLQARPQATQSAIDINQPFVSFHGRRDADNDEMIESFETGRKIAQAGGVLLVGGAVGSDFAAALGALSEGGKVIIIHFSDFNTSQYGYPEFTRQALTNIYNNQNQLFQEDNFMQFVVRKIFNHPRNRLREIEIFTKLVNRLATLMTLIAVAPNHPIIQELLREINTQLPPTAAVAFYTLRVVSDQPRRTAAESAEIRDKLMAAISDLTIEGPSRGPGSGTAKAVAFAQQVAQQAPNEKAVMTMQEILASDIETIRAKLTELNEARKRNLEAYKQRQQP